MTDGYWLAVLPLKPPAAAKSRLRGALPGTPHADLVVAMLLDTVAAALACPLVARLVVVCDDAGVRAAVGAAGGYGVPDVPAAGLNAALRYGARIREGVGSAGRADPAGGTGVLALTADLPALRPGELTAALTAAADAATDAPALAGALGAAGAHGAGRAAFVPDAAGTGTVLLAAPAGVDLVPEFGRDSAAAHAASGARRLAGDWPGLRRDVDTAADLAAAVLLGPGPRTAALAASGHHPTRDRPASVR